MTFLFVLSLAGFASSVNLRSVDPMLPAIAADFGITLGRAALLASAYSFPYAIMQVVLGPIGDAIGKTRLIRLSLAVLSLSLAVSAVAPNYPVALVARALAGVFAGGIVPVAMALIGDRVALAERQPALSRFVVATIVGQLFGAAASGLLASTVSWRAVFALAALFVAGAWLATLLRLDGEGEVRHRLTLARGLLGYRAVLANPASTLAFAATACEGALFFGLFPFVAPMLAGRGAPGTLAAGIAIAAFGIGGVLYGLVVRRLVKTLGQWQMMRLGGLVAAASYLGLAVPLPWESAILCFLVLGFGFYMVHNTLQTLATELAPGARGSALALFASCFFLGQGIGPAAGGAVSRAVGYGPLFIGAAALTGLLGMGAAAAIRRRLP